MTCRHKEKTSKLKVKVENRVQRDYLPVRKNRGKDMLVGENKMRNGKKKKKNEPFWD